MKLLASAFLPPFVNLAVLSSVPIIHSLTTKLGRLQVTKIAIIKQTNALHSRHHATFENDCIYQQKNFFDGKK